LARHAPMVMLWAVLMLSAMLFAQGATLAWATFRGENGKIAFASLQDQRRYWEIYVINPDGTDQKQLTVTPAHSRGPAWSHDGSKIAFYSDQSGDDEIYVMNADGSHQRRLTANAGADWAPSWSPDGSKIVFASDRDGSLEIYVMNADGTNQKRLTVTGVDNRDADWQPLASYETTIPAAGLPSSDIYPLSAAVLSASIGGLALTYYLFISKRKTLREIRMSIGVGKEPSKEEYRKETEKAVVTITESDGACSFLVEVPGASATKLKQEIRVDRRTKDTLVKKYEMTAVLANYLSLSRDGLNPPKPQLLTLDLDAQLRELGDFCYRLLIPRGVSDYLQAREGLTHLWFEIDEGLLDIPWELMYHQGEFLCIKYAIGRRLLTEEQHATRNPRQVEHGKMRILLIGNPSEDLPQSQREIDILYARMHEIPGIEVVRRVGSEMDKQGFLKALSAGFDVVHYAGHASFQAQEPDRSSLTFKDCSCYAYEIGQFLQTPPSIVFVNACSSAREGATPVIKYETAIPSLARTFLYSGVRAYVGSMWSVHDASAAEFATHFYRCLISGYTIGDAIRSARKQIYQREAGSVAWSSFVLYGDPESRLIRPRGRE